MISGLLLLLLVLGILKGNVVIIKTVGDEPRYCYHIVTFAGHRLSVYPSLTPNDDDDGINRRRRGGAVVAGNRGHLYGLGNYFCID